MNFERFPDDERAERGDGAVMVSVAAKHGTSSVIASLIYSKLFPYNTLMGWRRAGQIRLQIGSKYLPEEVSYLSLLNNSLLTCILGRFAHLGGGFVKNVCLGAVL